MIRINRTSVPSSFESTRLDSIRQIVESFFLRPHADRIQEKFNFPPFPDEIKKAVEDQFKSKCAYCESKLGSFSPSVIDKFRPQRGARGLNDGDFFDDHYWWLAYNWFNLYLACPECNFQKASWFPINGPRAAVKVSGPELLLEQPVLIDPCDDIPAEHFTFTDKGYLEPLSERGKTTIEILKLNREALVKARYEELTSFKKQFEQFKLHSSIELQEETNSEDFAFIDSPEMQILDLLDTHPVHSFVGLKRKFLFEWIKGDLKTREYLVRVIRVYSKAANLLRERLQTLDDLDQLFKKLFNQFFSETDDKQNEENLSRLDSIERIEIRNFRSIKEISIAFNYETEGQAPWILFLGENGSGKSSILQAITLTLIDREYRDQLELSGADFCWNSDIPAKVDIHLVGKSTPVSLTITPTSFVDNGVKYTPYLLAYGATRLMPQRKIFSENVQKNARVRNLFDPTTALHNASEWLYNLPNERFEYMVRGLRQLLMLRNEDRIIKSQQLGKIIVNHIGGLNSLEEMSEGYKTVIALAVDIMQMLEKDNATLEEVKGTVIIDEIEAHLHPRWKMRIVSSFREVFPQVQFIVTTHDPLCLRGLKKSEPVLMQRDKDSHEVILYTDLPSPEAYRVDQLLTSNFFGLYSTIDPVIEDNFNKLYKLLALKNKSKKDVEDIEKLKNELKDKKQLGDSLREELMYNVIDELLAKEYDTSKFIRRENLSDDIIEGVREIWQKNNIIE